jgi:hypothetical protein
MSIRSSKSVLGKRLAAFARASTCLLAILVVLLASCLRSAHARLGEALLGFGDQLMKMQDLKANSAPRQLNINGLSMGVLTLSTALDVAGALDRFQNLCRQRGGLQVPSGLANKLGPGRTAFDATFRQEGSTEGVLACIDSGHPLSLDQLTERLAAMRDSGDLAALGELRYVFARRSGATTTLLVFWTDGSAPLLKMFPPKGDAPGRDPENVPRPKGSRRVLSATEHGLPYHLTLYSAVTQSPDALVSWYRHALEVAGWRVAPGGSASLRAQRGGRNVVVACSPSKDGVAVATVAELD